MNANEVAEAVSMRGNRDGLAVGPDEASEFNLEEGAFYGNLFIDDPNPDTPPDWQACRGANKAANPTQGGLANRKCADEDPDNPGFTYCGFKFGGDCQDFTPAVPTPYACKRATVTQTATGPYTTYADCHDAPGPGKWKDLASSREVMTVFVGNL